MSLNVYAWYILLKSPYVTSTSFSSTCPTCLMIGPIIYRYFFPFLTNSTWTLTKMFFYDLSIIKSFRWHGSFVSLALFLSGRCSAGCVWFALSSVDLSIPCGVVLLSTRSSGLSCTWSSPMTESSNVSFVARRCFLFLLYSCPPSVRTIYERMSSLLSILALNHLPCLSVGSGMTRTMSPVFNGRRSLVPRL